MGLGKFENDFYCWFLGTFCLLKEFLKKNRKKNFFPKKFKFYFWFPWSPLWVWKKNEKNLKFFFLQFDSRYQNVPIRQNKSWFQNFQISKGWATIRLQNGAQGRPALCSILWLNCGLAIWVRKVLKTVLFMVYGYILILGMVFQFRDDDFQTFLRGTP